MVQTSKINVYPALNDLYYLTCYDNNDAQTSKCIGGRMDG